MLKIIAAFLIAPVFAEVLPAPDCDINELTQRCYVSVCSNVQHNGMPKTTAELETALAAMNYRMPEASARAADTFARSLVDLNRRSNALVETTGFDGIAEDILSHLDTNLGALHTFFRSDLPIVQRPDGRIEVVINDMAEGDTALLRRMGTFLQSYVEMFQGVTQANARMAQPGAEIFFRNFLSGAETYFAVSNPARAQEIRNRRERLTTSSSPVEIATAALSNLTQEDLRGIFRTKFIGMKNDLAAFMRTRSETESRRVSKGLRPGPLRESISRSCQLAQYMMGRVAGSNPEAAFNQAKTKLFLENGLLSPKAQLAGCGLLLLQMPIFMGLYFCLQESVFFRLSPFLWINNLAAPDMLQYWSESIPMISESWNVPVK